MGLANMGWPWGLRPASFMRQDREGTVWLEGGNLLLGTPDFSLAQIRPLGESKSTFVR